MPSLVIRMNVTVCVAMTIEIGLNGEMLWCGLDGYSHRRARFLEVSMFQTLADGQALGRIKLEEVSDTFYEGHRHGSIKEGWDGHGCMLLAISREGFFRTV